MRGLKKLLTAVVACGLIYSCSSDSESKTNSKQQKDNYKIVGYVAGWKNTDYSTFDPNKFTHINYAFANIVNGKVVCERKCDTIELPKLISFKKQNPELKILISVGGWVWSDHFSDVALTAESRSVFVKSAIDFVRYWKVDGVDLDWEYPGQLGEDNVFRPEDKDNFNLLLKDLREALDKESKLQKRKEKLLLTIATGADQPYIDNTKMAIAQKYLDFINIMTYDFYNGFHNTTGLHNNLYDIKGRTKDNSCVQSVDRHINAGIPAEKLVLGLPFYGRQWTGVKSTENNGLFQDAESVGTIIPYGKFKKFIGTPEYKKIIHPDGKTPFLWNEKERTLISYDDEQSLKLKIDYMKKKGMGGVMYWEYNNDNGNELLDVVNKYL